MDHAFSKQSWHCVGPIASTHPASPIPLLHRWLADRFCLINQPAIHTSCTTKISLCGWQASPLLLHEQVGAYTVEELISRGTFLNSEVGINGVGLVPRLSIMLLRAFCMISGEWDLVNCITAAALCSDPMFDDMEVFHAQWEVLLRLVGCVGKMSLADFYSRNHKIQKSNSSSKTNHRILREIRWCY